MHSFFIDPPVGDQAALPRDEARHAARVLRLGPGDRVCALDGAGTRWAAEILPTDGEGLRVRLLEKLPDNESVLRLTLYQGLPKAEKLDFIVQKLTELGARSVAPVRMERCVVKLDGKDGKKRAERLSRIAAEAAKQCRRGLVTQIAEPMSWDEALGRMAAHDLVLVPWEEAEGLRLRDVYARRPDARDIALVIGPEGGMSEGEVRRLNEAGALSVTLGPRILRTETAAVAAAALAMQLWGDI